MTSLIWQRRGTRWRARSADGDGTAWYVVTKARVGYWLHIRIAGCKQWHSTLARAMRFAQSCEPNERWAV